MVSLFPNPRRVVTGHDSKGNAIILDDQEIPCVPVGVNANFAVLYETHKFPASNAGWEDPIQNRTASLANDKGIVLRVVDFKPRTLTMMHRTQSLDFGIIHEGELICHLDNGEKINVKAGDVCVQRGTIHAWDNQTDKPARVFFVLSASEPIEIDGKVLETAGFEKKDVESGGH